MLSSDRVHSSLELQVASDSAGENLDRDALIERRGDDLQEVIKLILFILSTLGSNQIETHFVLGILGQVHILHSRVCYVNLGLESTFFLTDLRNKHGHLSENDSIIQNESDENDENVDNFSGCSRAHFVSTEGKNGHVEHHHILVPLSDFLEIIETIVTATLNIDEIKRRHPLGLEVDDEEPNAANDVHDEQQSEDQLEDLHHRLLVLLQLQLLDDLREAGDSRHLEDLQQLQRLDLHVRPGDRRDQVDDEHALHVALCDLLALGHLLTLLREEGRAELHEDVHEEEQVRDRGGHGVPRLVRQRLDNKFETDSERGDYSENENEHVPHLFFLAHILVDGQPGEIFHFFFLVGLAGLLLRLERIHDVEVHLL